MSEAPKVIQRKAPGTKIAQLFEEEDKYVGPDHLPQDERGWPVLVIERVFPCMSNSDIAARAHFFEAYRKFSEKDYMAGRGMTVETTVRDDPRYPPVSVRYEVGGRPRTERSYAEMEAELVAAVKAAHAAVVRPGR